MHDEHTITSDPAVGSTRLVRLHGGSVWRDAKGRITKPGDLRAVTAQSCDGRLWNVSGDIPVPMPNAKLTDDEERAKPARIAASG